MPEFGAKNILDEIGVVEHSRQALFLQVTYDHVVEAFVGLCFTLLSYALAAKGDRQARSVRSIGFDGKGSPPT